ncbi:hypothetical protein FHU33_1969 [Blastococcus colisei]|uniref:Uncharacterized protein n=1 Tax=Blastococcus colisei TaxID=1564162 RepID=A0A543PEP9_9ACTN|nr:hypothetical protein [Blastococcus colisei]TQN42565.1 hypothetical protein FHU33_1969 [Blastococcus colisei]
MDELHPPKSEALRSLYWRSEILQVMFWLRGEGLGDVVDAPLLERFLGVEARVGLAYLDQLVVDGFLERVATGYALSATGMAEGRTEFALSFSDLTRPSHGECSADCWCHNSVEEALACAAERPLGGNS